MNLSAQLQLRTNSTAGLRPGLQGLRQVGLLCDVCLVGEDGTAVEAHTVVLSACSEVFRTMLSRYQHNKVNTFLTGNIFIIFCLEVVHLSARGNQQPHRVAA